VSRAIDLTGQVFGLLKELCGVNNGITLCKNCHKTAHSVKKEKSV